METLTPPSSHITTCMQTPETTQKYFKILISFPWKLCCAPILKDEAIKQGESFYCDYDSELVFSLFGIKVSNNNKK